MKITCLYLLAALAVPATAAPHVARGPISLPLGARRANGGFTKRASASSIETLSDALFTTYHVNVSVGTPPQTIALVLDTVISDVVLMESDLAGYGDFTVFKSNASSTFTKSNETAQVRRYFVSATAATDTIAVAGMTVQNQTLAMAEGTRVPYTGAGVLGLGIRDPVINGTALIRNLAAQWPEPIVGVYIKRHDWVSGGHFQSPNQWVAGMGELLLGGLNQSYYTGDVHYADVVNNTAWSLTLDGAKVDGNAVQSNFTFDNKTVAPNMAVTYGRTASHITTLPEDIANSMHAAVPGAQLLFMDAGGGNLTTYSVPCNTTAVFTFTFGGIDYAMQPSDWIIKEGNGCMSTIVPSPTSEVPYNMFSLGTGFLQTVYTALKLSNPPQIGFAQLASDLPRVNGSETAQHAGGQSSNGSFSGITSAIPTPTGGAGANSAAASSAAPSGKDNDAAKVRAPVNAVALAGLAVLALL